MKKYLALAAFAAAGFSLPALAADTSSPNNDKSTHKEAVEKKSESSTGAGASSDTKTHKKSKAKAKKPKNDTSMDKSK